jgi:hypothetical protein
MSEHDGRFEAPRRLFADEAAGPGLRAALREARGDVPSRKRLVGIAAGLAAAGVPVATRAGWLAALGAKGKLVALIAVASAGGTVVALRAGAPPRVAPESAPATLPARAIEPAAAPAIQPAIEDAPEPAAPPAPATERPRVFAAKPARARLAAPADADVVAEAALLEGVRATLPAEPRAALERLRAYAARFPRGALAQEAELLSIEAFAALGDHREVRARSARFLRLHPTSAHARRVRALDAGSR